MPEQLDARFVEQGLSVFEITDYPEHYVAATKDEAIACAIKDWGYATVEAAARDGCLDVEGIDRVDLDANKINMSEDCTPEGPIITYRERIKEMLRDGEEVPSFFAGGD